MKKLLIGILLFTCSFINAQSIHFHFTDGTNSSYNLSEVRKITFDNDLMNMHLWDGTIYSWSVFDIGWYEYDQGTVNTEMLTDKFSLNIFPNPFNDKFLFKYKLDKVTDVKYSILDINGNVVNNWSHINQDAGQYLKDINVEDHPAGTYYLNIKFNEISISKKIIKQ